VRERSSGEVRGKVFAVITLEGQNPREVPVAVGLKRRAAARQSWQAWTRKPTLVGALCRLVRQNYRRANGRRVLPG